jgi:hypothetical protein
MKKWCSKCKQYISEPSTSEISKYAKFWNENKCYYCNSILRDREDAASQTDKIQSDKDNGSARIVKIGDTEIRLTGELKQIFEKKITDSVLNRDNYRKMSERNNITSVERKYYDIMREFWEKYMDGVSKEHLLELRQKAESLYGKFIDGYYSRIGEFEKLGTSITYLIGSSILQNPNAKPFEFSSGESVITLEDLVLVADKYPKETRNYLLNDTLANWLWSIDEKECANFTKILRIRCSFPFPHLPPIDPFEPFLSFISRNDPLKRAEIYLNYSQGVLLDEVNVRDDYLVEHLLIGEDHKTILNISQKVSRDNLKKFLEEFEAYESSIKTNKYRDKNKVFKLRTSLFGKSIDVAESNIKRLMPKLHFILDSAV